MNEISSLEPQEKQDKFIKMDLIEKLKNCVQWMAVAKEYLEKYDEILMVLNRD